VKETLRIAVVSDLHAYDILQDGEATPSHLCTISPEDQPTLHPIAGLLDRIDKDGLTADALLCCGDLGDKSRPAGIKYAWERLHLIKARLKADDLFVTSGNHDLDSRYTHSDDAKGVLQSLTPMYPLADENLTNKYWSRNYVVLTQDRYRIVLLNSSAYHGTRNEEFAHGRVTIRTVEALKTELETLEKAYHRDLNILVCHHHPLKYADIGDPDYSDMEGAPRLVDALGSGDYGHWIIIHGHRHQPRLTYATGPSTAPIVFSAGSLTAVLYPELQLLARNQFYIIEFPLDEIKTLGLGLIGTFQSWDWVLGLGWRPASRNSGLPAYGGFGNRHILPMLDNIEAVINSRGEPWTLDWEDVVTEVPGLKFLLPSDLETLIKRLKTDKQLNVLRDDNGQPAQVGRKKS
jgi:predicted phosphodiesterase